MRVCHHQYYLPSFLLGLVQIGGCLASKHEGQPTAKAETGIFHGTVDPEFPNTNQFRSIPYAEAPVASRRWLPPKKLAASTDHHWAINFPPSCPQFVSAGPTIWNQYMNKGNLINNGNQNSTSGLVAQTTSEDCLHLAIWSPVSATPTAKLPVLFFIPGGGFETGGIEVPFQMPAPWVERSQAHIVVTINYRLNIFGYPNARGLQEQNLGILDQRLALEWVRDNIAAFGGDPSRIMQWGQSAGSISTDIHTFAYREDPIASSYFLQSASLKTPNVLGGLIAHDPKHTNFTFVAKQLGCDFVDNSEAELDCLRNLPFAIIENFIGQYADSGTQPSLVFSPVVDEKIVFSDYHNRTQEGQFAKKPVIVGHTANEASSLVPYPAHNITEGPHQPTVIAIDLAAWVCPALDIGNARSVFDIPIYRYQYAGRFPNLNPLPWLGAYHSSDIPLIFGTHGLLTEYGNSTELEVSVSRAMQDHVVAFAAEPWGGPERIGWQPTAISGKTIRFGANGIAVQYVGHEEVDGACVGRGSYNSFP